MCFNLNICDGVMNSQHHALNQDDTEYTYEEMQNEMRAKLMALADNACSYMHNDR